MANIEIIEDIMKTVSIPVMAKTRIGHFVEAQVLQELGVDFIDESEVLTPADEAFHIEKRNFNIPFVCGATNLGEALRRINEGAAMIRSKGEAGTGNIVEAVRHMRCIAKEINELKNLNDQQIDEAAKLMRVPVSLVNEIKTLGKLNVPLFSAGGIATPADAALMMQLGAETVFVGSGIFKSEDPSARAKAIVKATTHYLDPEILLQVCKDVRGAAMPGLDINLLKKEERFQDRGW